MIYFILFFSFCWCKYLTADDLHRSTSHNICVCCYISDYCFIQICSAPDISSFFFITSSLFSGCMVHVRMSTVLIFCMLILPVCFFVQAETVLFCVFTFFHPLCLIKGNSCKTLMQWLQIGALTDISLPAMKSFCIIIIGCWSRQISPMDLYVSVLQGFYVVALWGHYLTLVDILFNFHTTIVKFHMESSGGRRNKIDGCDYKHKRLQIYVNLFFSQS